MTMEGPTGPIRAFACLEGLEGLVEEELRSRLHGATVLRRHPGLLLVKDPALDPRAALAEPVHPVFSRAEFALWSELRDSRPGRLAARLAESIAPAIDEGAPPPALHVWAQGEALREERAREAKALDRGLRRELGGRVRSKIAAGVGDDVIDVALVGPGTACLGAHRRTELMSAFPGGQRRLAARPESPSRAHLKLEEGLEWASLPLAAGEVALDVGCAPGGWSLILLALGLAVHGIDPVEVAPVIAAHPRFRQHRGPIRTFPAERLPSAPWIFCDMNGPPLDALGQVERLISRCRGVRALFHTIKLSDDPPLESVAAVRGRLAALGFGRTRVRHLYHNRREVTLVAERC